MSALSWDTLYTGHAAEYEILVSHEDYQAELIAALLRLQPLAGRLAAEFGCGTGRITGLLSGHLWRLHSFDFTLPMLRVAQANRRRQGWTNVSLALADSRRMPLSSGWADFAIERWAFLQIAVWNPHDWQIQLGRALDEMQRVVKPGAKMLLIETLGTGESTPKVVPFFDEVYDFLESRRSFTPLALRTDYCFENMDQIHLVVLPLFGPGMLDRLVQTDLGWVLPECTGLW